MRRAEAELGARGEYSWVTDIRSRVEIARAVARDAGDFKELLGDMGVDVKDNSEKAAARDWIFALSDTPSCKVAGESLGLFYGRERLLARFSFGASTLAMDGGRAIVEVTADAVRAGNLGELRGLAEAVNFIDGNRIRSMAELREAAKDSPAVGEKIPPVAERVRMLPERAARPLARKLASAKPRSRSGAESSSTRRDSPQQQGEAPVPQPRRDDRSSPTR